ncbi:MAG: GNAT family N-acetyltransferase [Desulfurococcaceae archaeon]|nr:GNAT family N-acetyltransferase [Desulfurococcaceae archaeon]
MKYKELQERLREVVSAEGYRTFLKDFSDDIARAYASNERRLVVLCGSDPIKVAGLTIDLIRRYIRKLRRLRKSAKLSVIHVFHDEFPDARLRATLVKDLILSKKLVDTREVTIEQAVYEASKKYLGTTQDVLILDLTNDLKPNDVGRLIGIVRGGGLIVMWGPPLESWETVKTIFKSNLVTPRHPEPRNIFIRYFVRKLMKHEGIYLIDADTGKLVKSGQVMRKHSKEVRSVKIPEDAVFPRSLYELALTQDQVNVIKLIEDNLVPKPGSKHVAVIITSDRGRGKSSAIGIAIIGLIKELMKFKNRVRVAVTASDSSAIQSLMMLAEKGLNALGLEYRKVVKEGDLIELKGDRFSIEYWEPYTVTKLKVDVVVVDEAAGLPVPLLHTIWKNFNRTIYATTIHGYEGAGRGFSVRFLKRLREDPKTLMITYEMSEPIRYSANDPIEKFQFDALLLDAEPDELTDEDIKEIERGNLEYVTYEPEYLFSEAGEKELRSLFGIYVLAHYRNEPDDLGRLADAPHHSMRAVRIKSSGKIVGAAQLAEEGGLSDELINELLVGGKIPGNIIPDRLLKYFRLRELGKGIGWRIVRIAVHIDVQGMGIGSFLLNEIVNEAVRRGYSWVGAGFGLSRELLNFWLKNNFKLLHLSPDRNPVSGEYTALVVRPLNSEWVSLIDTCAKDFTIRLIGSLHTVYRDLESDVTYLILKSGINYPELSERFELTEAQKERLKLYLEGLMTYESAADAVNFAVLKSVVEGKLNVLTPLEGQVCVARCLKGLSWEEITQELNYPSSKAVVVLRKALEKLCDYKPQRDVGGS